MERDNLPGEMRFYYGNFQVSLSTILDDHWLIRHQTTRFGRGVLWEIVYKTESAEELKDEVYYDLLNNTNTEKYSPDKNELLELYSKWKKLP